MFIIISEASVVSGDPVFSGGWEAGTEALRRGPLGMQLPFGADPNAAP